MFFNKEVVCEKCNNLINRKNSCVIDYTHQGRIKHGIKIRVCQKCCIEELIDSFQKRTKKAIIVQPSSKFNTYVFYNFKDIENTGYFPHKTEFDRFYEYMQRLLPQDHDKCSFCSNSAIYTWCTLSIYNREKPWSVEIPQKKEKHIFVCQNCIVDLFKEKIEKENISFSYVYPMVDEIGYYTPWEV